MKKVVAALFVVASSSVYAQSISGFFQVPTLDEGGLVALVAIVGVVGALVARRRIKK